MAHGFLAINGNNQVLVSSETRNLHFVGKALLNRSALSFNKYGGLRHWVYQIGCNVPPVPFFTMPVDAYYAVAAVRQVAAGVWEIEIIRSGTSELAPEVYVFSDPRGATGNGGTNYGMLILRDDGTPAFDSRLAPLAVTGGAMVTPPRSPINPTWNIVYHYHKPMGFGEYNYWYQGDYELWISRQDYSKRSFSEKMIPGDKGSSDATPLLGPTQNSLYAVDAGARNYKPIFFFPSLAQSVRIVTGDYYPNKYYRCFSNYWAIYRSGISFAGGYIRCGWIAAVAGCYWKANSLSTGFSIGSGVDASSIVSAGSGGQPPYFNETLNLQPTAVIIGNGTRYD